MEILLILNKLKKDEIAIKKKVPKEINNKFIDLAGQKCNLNFLVTSLLKRDISKILANNKRPPPMPVFKKVTATIVGVNMPYPLNPNT